LNCEAAAQAPSFFYLYRLALSCLGAGAAKNRMPLEENQAPNALAPLFNQVYESGAAKDRVLLTMKKLETSSPRFASDFEQCVDRLLPEYKRDAGTERVVDLVLNVVASAGNEDDDGMLLLMLSSLVKKSLAKDKGVRLRCVQLLAGLLASPHKSFAVLPVEMLAKVETVALTRAGDKIPSIRVEAAR
jgi:hypothetical protein